MKQWKSERVGTKSHIRKSATPNKCLKNVSKWGYHENRDITDISANYQKYFWILKEGKKGYILYQLVFSVKV
jgi:hypothetical protein